MNEDRTFGIEIECHASVGEHRIADRIRQFFADNLIPHVVEVTGRYAHDTDQSNTSTWKIKPDGSVMTLNQRMGQEFPYDMEIVSPILKGSAGLKAVQIVCRALDDGMGNVFATASRTCGFHVHHAVNEESLSAIRNVANAWLMDEKFFFYALPDSRLSNTYCSAWKGHDSPYAPLRPCRDDEDPFEWYSGYIGGRRKSLNFKSYPLRGTFEWRMHSGTVEFPKVSTWILMTQRWLDLAAKGCITKPNGRERDFNDFIKSFQTTSFEVNQASIAEQPQRRRSDQSDSGAYYENQFLRASRSIVARESFRSKFIHPRAKKQKIPKASIKTGAIIKQLLSGWVTKQDIVRDLNREFGRLPSGKQAKFVSGQLTNMKNPKWGYGFNIKKSGKHFRLLPIGMDQLPEDWDGPSIEPEVVQHIEDSMVVNVDELTEEQRTAITFFIDRVRLFEGRRSPNNIGSFGFNESTEEQQGYERTADDVPPELN